MDAFEVTYVIRCTFRRICKCVAYFWMFMSWTKLRQDRQQIISIAVPRKIEEKLEVVRGKKYWLLSISLNCLPSYNKLTIFVEIEWKHWVIKRRKITEDQRYSWNPKECSSDGWISGKTGVCNSVRTDRKERPASGLTWDLAFASLNPAAWA